MEELVKKSLPFLMMFALLICFLGFGYKASASDQTHESNTLALVEESDDDSTRMILLLAIFF